ncbi:MAG: histidine kinase [Cohnella sp.]|nr:histidine kinase [Cohnella sp.]
MRVAICLLVALLVGCCVPYTVLAAPSASPVSQRQDLSGWYPQEDGVVSLKGPWALYWNRLLEPGDFSGHPQDDALIVDVPAQWQAYSIRGQALSNEGYATYRTTFQLSPGATTQPLGLYVHNVASAYRLWINGEPLSGNGTVGAAPADMIPRSYPRTLFFVPRPGDNELVIQVSNFSQRTGGIWEAISLGDAGRIASMHRNQVIVWTFVAGSLLLMAVFSSFLYLFRKKELGALWFGLVCLAICIRSSLLGESYAYSLFPWLSWEWGVKLEYLSEIVTMLGIAAFVNDQYPKETVRRIFPGFGAALAAFGAFVLAVPAKVYTQYMVPYILLLLMPVFLYVLYVYIRAALRRRTGSRANMIGFSGFFASVIYEILYYTGYASVEGLVSFGLLFFLLTQLLNLSRRFTLAVTRSETLSVELNQVIESQEDTIRRRTRSLQELNARLEEGNRELNRIEHVRSALLAEVYHDLTTPITSIKGFSKAMMTDVIPKEEAPLYAGRIYERSQLLEKLIDDVIELTRLKTGELPFSYADIPLLPFLRQLCQQYEAEADARRITLRWEEPIVPLAPGMELCVSVDPFRFERVFANLVSNAVKYTPAEGTVRVWLEFHPANGMDEGVAAIHVTDTGIGIPEAELPHIFKRRYRVPGIQQAASGSGLGLAICAAIMARHGGDISATSREGAGSDFILSLPARARTSTPADDSANEGAEHGSQHSSH